MPSLRILRVFRSQPPRRWTLEELEQVVAAAQRKVEEAAAEVERRSELAQRAREDARAARHEAFELQRAADEAALLADRMESRSRVADEMNRQAALQLDRAYARVREAEGKTRFEA